MISKDTSQAGWALPTTVFALAVMLSTVYALTLESIDALVIAREPQRSEQLHNAITTAARTAGTSIGRCEPLAVSFEGKTLTYEVCREKVRPFLTRPLSVSLPSQLIDYDMLFSQASECASPPTPTQFNDINSPFAPRNCALPSTVSAPVILLDNIIGESTELRSTGQQILTLATPGRLIISHELRLSSDLLVVAGGGVEIASIRALPSSSVKVTVISALGVIRIGAVDGDLSLLIAGRDEITAPETLPTVEYPLPPLRPPSFYGFKEAG